ncbi:MAG TPA: hypothetical protein VFA48_12750 [Gammaproteobacteria bacterium]|nr:hypothetical protein [Gammaproteobacteria bacterium]
MSSDWSARRERGNSLWIAFMRLSALRGGRRLARLCLYPAVAWFLLFTRREQRGIREFLDRALPRPPRWRDVARNYWNFAAVTLDRTYLLAGRTNQLDIRIHKPEPLLDLHSQGRGAILLGAHVGSFFAMRALARQRVGLDIHILFYPEHNARITRAFAALDPDLASRCIPLGSPDVLMQLGGLIEKGSFVAALADRVTPADSHVLDLPFLGKPARFATGVMQAALVLGCPVLFYAGIYRGGNRYDLYLEQLSAGKRVARADRTEAVNQLTREYVACLERYARDAPDNWFNFYDYWAH